MNTQTNQQPAARDAAFCTTTYSTCCRLVTNAYRCDQRPFVAASLWAIRKQRRR